MAPLRHVLVFIFCCFSHQTMCQVIEDASFATTVETFAQKLLHDTRIIQDPVTQPSSYSFSFQDEGEMPTLNTPWTDKVDPNSPLPEYPRPQMVRENWLNLNGVWEFEAIGTVTDENLPLPFNRTLSSRIVVPFPVESPLSGIHQHHAGMAHLLYRRTFTVPSAWRKDQILLHFGAVDWEAKVYVNKRFVGSHRGGYDKFHFDIADALVQDGINELLVSVFDPTEFGHIAVGKQRLHPPRHPSSIWYTSNTGIWQTVWLEPVPAAHIERLDLIPNVDDQLLSVHVVASRAARGMAVEARAKLNGTVVGTGRGVTDEPFQLSIPDPQLWSPETPTLYDISVYLLDTKRDIPSGAGGGYSGALPSDSAARALLSKNASESAGENENASESLGENNGSDQLSEIALAAHESDAAAALSQYRDAPGEAHSGRAYVDRVDGYFGMRKISLGRIGNGGNLRVLLNDRFVFQLGMLDQGYWPDGIYTAPTDEALASDIQFAKSLGYNLLRKHIKVEPDRWYYHADRLGMLVWQDMPSMFWEDDLSGIQPARPTPAEQNQWESEFKAMILGHYSFPCIVIYVVFNEGWGQYDSERVTNEMMAVDPSRLFNCASGWRDANVGHLVDMHKYVGPDSPLPTPSRAAVLGEFGGLGYRTEGHLWIPQEAFCYEMETSFQQLHQRYLGLIAALNNLVLDPNTSLSAAVYTEVTDVEAEINGWLTYDRRFNKAEAAGDAIAAAHLQLIQASMALNM